MSVTAQEMFDTAMNICEFCEKEGRLYSLLKSKAPALCDLAQRDIIGYSYINRTVSVDCSKTPDMTRGNFKLFSLPDEVISVQSISFPLSDTQTEGYTSLGYVYVPVSYNGDAECLCRVFPKPIKNANDTFTLDDNTVRSLVPYFLAGDFLLEENPAKSALYTQRYEQGKSKLRLFGEQTAIENVGDVYGGGIDYAYR